MSHSNASNILRYVVEGKLIRLHRDSELDGGRVLLVIGTQALELSVAEAEMLKYGLTTLLGKMEETGQRRENQPVNAGAPWDEALDTLLAQRWYAGATVSQIAAEMGRTTGSISSRLVRIGLVESREEMRHRSGAAEG